jgi:hypothetical protein
MVKSMENSHSTLRREDQVRDSVLSPPKRSAGVRAVSLGRGAFG